MLAISCVVIGSAACAPDVANPDANPGANLGGMGGAGGSQAGAYAAVSGKGGAAGVTLPGAGKAGTVAGGAGSAGFGSVAAGSGSVVPSNPGAGSAGASGRGMGGRFGTAGTGTGGAAGGVAGGAGPAAGSGGTPATANGETGRLVGITAAHNVARARQNNPVPSPALPELTWSNDLAKIAQAYAEKLASTTCQLVHSQAPGLGENISYYGGFKATTTQVVEGWAGEEECYTFGNFMTTDKCDMTCTTKQHSNGCGHYTQVVWRKTTQVGCGVSLCSKTTAGLSSEEIWVCNYK
ncbi:MAG: hypothetical protein RL701_2538, partial [Pseudomonadota bacterium]